MLPTVNAIEQQIIDGVATNGWFAVNYVPAPDDPEEWFTYTVGLTKTAGWPEMICLGLDEKRSVGILRDAIAECWERSVEPKGGLELVNVIKGRSVRLKRLDGVTAPYFAMASWYSDHTGTTARAERLQLMWPDADGRFPDDPHCDPHVRQRQTPRGAN
ncbi:MAG: DUF4262 domain-containing protein [Sphingomicrobium sp.]